MIKILHLINSFDIGGMENGLANLINYMDTETFRHYICSLTTIGKMKERITRGNVQYFALNKRQKANYFLFLKIISIIKYIKPNITHTRSWGPFIDGTLAAYICKVPMRVHSYHGKGYDEINIKPRKRLLAQAMLSKVTTHIVTLNNSMKSAYAKEIKISENKITVLPNGVNINKFYIRNDKECLQLREDFNIHNNEFIIGSVGRLDKIKNFGCLIKAFALVNQKIPQAKLIIVGDGAELNTLKQIVSKKSLKNKVNFWGHRDDISQILNLFDIYVQPSLYEGFSNTLLEGMASKIPIIASKVGGNPEIITHDYNGLLFNPYDYKKLAENIIYLFDNKKMTDSFTERSHTLIKKKYSLEQMKRNYEQFYKALF